MKWKVRLTGREIGLEDLCESFVDDPSVFSEEDKYFIWCSQFDKLEDANQVRKLAKHMVQGITNLGRRDSLHVRDLEVSHVHEIKEDGTERVNALAEGATIVVRSGPARVTTTHEDGTVETNSPADRMYERTKQLLNDEKVRRVVELLDRDDSWVNLYRIYEYIQDSTDGENIVRREWWSGNQKNLFKQTANSRGAIGDEARHGSEQIPPPDEPMTHNEATRLVNTLVDEWLQHRKEL